MFHNQVAYQDEIHAFFCPAIWEIWFSSRFVTQVLCIVSGSEKRCPIYSLNTLKAVRISELLPHIKNYVL